MESGEYVLTLDDHWHVSRLDGAAARDEGSEVTLPHCVVPLSWGEWDPSSWERRWRYAREVVVPELVVPEPPGVTRAGGRWHLEFEAVASAVRVTVNGSHVGTYLGGYLPSRFDVTDALTPGTNQLVVEVDATFTVDTPPNVVDADSSVIDFWQPGGIYRSARLRLIPPVRVEDLVVRQVDILNADRSLEVTVTVTGPVPASAAATVRVELLDLDGSRVLAAAERSGPLDSTDVTDGTDGTGAEVLLTLTELGDLELWDVEAPRLYLVRATLLLDGARVHARSIRTGFREAVFRRDGFFLNGRRLSLRGANRHQLYPWTGFAMPDRVQRRDAQILRDDLNCVMVRCSHYPQSAAFLDACDEFGLLVWEEAPGWQHLGGPDWQDRACRDTEQLIRRDRHRPSIVVWGARLNEMPDDTGLWARTEAIAKALDPSRQTSGTMHALTRDSTDFQHDVFSYDDYSTATVEDANGHRDTRPVLLPPREPWPYLLAEAVSQRSSPTGHYLRTDPSSASQHQALDYAVALDAVAADDRYCGLLAWVGFDYQTGFPGHRGVKTGGLADVFRIPKAGAALYRSQVDPRRRAVLEPAFAWGSGPGAALGPGPRALLCANVDRVQVHLGGRLHAVVEADRTRFPHLAYPPFFLDLPERAARGGTLPDLRLDGYLDGRLAVSRQFSAESDLDELLLTVDDAELVADGIDATRMVVGTVDRYGNVRAHGGGRVQLSLDGAGTLIGDNPFDIADLGGIGALWFRTRAGEAGPVTVRATLGTRTAHVVVDVVPVG